MSEQERLDALQMTDTNQYPLAALKTIVAFPHPIDKRTSPSFCFSCSVAFLAFALTGDFLAVEVWTNLEGPQQQYQDPAFVQVFSNLFAAPPSTWILQCPAGQWWSGKENQPSERLAAAGSSLDHYCQHQLDD
ncbi:MAG TPA: hypothetical protein VHV10_00625 [Ktedonobacteraceae bacterium]|nr:hypothetical protein [Ktedonobacteraceae bacterium]